MTCSLCDKPARARGWCRLHYERWRKHGDPNVRYPLKPDPAYKAVHLRLRNKRGKAADYPCVTCGQPARHWAYKNGGGGKPFSTDLDDYEPRCVPCHHKLDRPPRLLCSVGDCAAVHYARGMCNRHWQRWRNNQRVAKRNTSTQEEMRENK